MSSRESCLFLLQCCLRTWRPPSSSSDLHPGPLNTETPPDSLDLFSELYFHLQNKCFHSFITQLQFQLLCIFLFLYSAWVTLSIYFFIFNDMGPLALSVLKFCFPAISGTTISFVNHAFILSVGDIMDCRWWIFKVIFFWRCSIIFRLGLSQIDELLSILEVLLRFYPVMWLSCWSLTWLVIKCSSVCFTDVLLPSKSKWADIFYKKVKCLSFNIWYVLCVLLGIKYGSVISKSLHSVLFTFYTVEALRLYNQYSIWSN